MHILQPIHTKLKTDEAEKFLNQLNISSTQLPKIRINDVGNPEGTEIGDIVRIERVIEGKKTYYYRVVSL